MKRQINIFSLFAAVVLVVVAGCTKQLDTRPDTNVTSLNTFDDIKNALNGAYDGFQSNNYYNSPAASGSGSGWSTTPEVMGDDFVEALESLGNWRALSEMVYASDDPAIQGIFSQPYDIISRTNNLLQFITPYETGTTANEAKRIKAQVLAIRAHCHFDLLRYFAGDYGRNATGPGVPYVTTFDPLNPLSFLPARASIKDCYDKIYADLNDALIAFRQGGNTTGNATRNFIDSTVVYAMRARVNYYSNQWSEALADANVVLALRPITNSAGFIATFSTAGEAAPTTEVIWAIPSDNLLRPGGANSGSGPNYRVATPISNIIQAQGGAYVNSGIMRFNQNGVGNFPRTLNWKYPGVRSFKVFRAAEMLLIRAEAKQRLNLSSSPTALDDLNNLRTNRGVATGTETGTALLNAILLQRRIELIGEGFRWFDLKKGNRTITRTECGVQQGSPSTNCTVAPTSRGWAFPIPFNDLQVNPNLVQNPNY
jgi:starch-binding outer membrane protein, SusD/RagB family